MATERQKKAVVKVLENNGNVSKAMLEVGYPPTTAKNPQQLTRSKGFQRLMEKAGLTDKYLLAKHKSLLEKKEMVIIRNQEGSYTEMTDQPDTQAVSKGLDMAYKLKGRYLNSEGGVQNNIFIGIKQAQDKYGEE